MVSVESLKNLGELIEWYIKIMAYSTESLHIDYFYDILVFFLLGIKFPREMVSAKIRKKSIPRTSIKLKIKQ